MMSLCSLDQLLETIAFCFVPGLLQLEVYKLNLAKMDPQTGAYYLLVNKILIKFM